MAVVHLAFQTVVGPAGFLILGMEINPRVGVRKSQDIQLEIKIFEHVAVDIAYVGGSQSRARLGQMPFTTLVMRFLPRSAQGAEWMLISP